MKIMMSPLSLHDIFNGFIKVEPAPTHSYLCTETIPVNPKQRGQPKVTRQVRTENLMRLVITVGAWTWTRRPGHGHGYGDGGAARSEEAESLTVKSKGHWWTCPQGA